MAIQVILRSAVGEPWQGPRSQRLLLVSIGTFQKLLLGLQMLHSTANRSRSGFQLDEQRTVALCLSHV